SLACDAFCQCRRTGGPGLIDPFAFGADQTSVTHQREAVRSVRSASIERDLAAPVEPERFIGTHDVGKIQSAIRGAHRPLGKRAYYLDQFRTRILRGHAFNARTRLREYRHTDCKQYEPDALNFHGCDPRRSVDSTSFSPD